MASTSSIRIRTQELTNIAAARTRAPSARRITNEQLCWYWSLSYIFPTVFAPVRLSRNGHDELGLETCWNCRLSSFHRSRRVSMALQRIAVPFLRDYRNLMVVSAESCSFFPNLHNHEFFEMMGGKMNMLNRVLLAAALTWGYSVTQGLIYAACTSGRLSF